MAKNILQSKSKGFQKKIVEAPLLPGCYIYKNEKDKILYIGKAKIIRNRVRSYFNNYNRVEEKIRQMIDRAFDIEFVVTDSEVEALILESILIKKHKPKYNSMLVDDKSYVYVKFTEPKKDKSGYQVLPSIEMTRERTDDNGRYFGPYPDTRPVRRLLRRLRKIFPYCTSKNLVVLPKEKDHLIIAKSNRPCFQAQIGLCNGACSGNVTVREYLKNINNIEKFFKGEKILLTKELMSLMEKASKKKEYEEAIKYRNMLNDIKYVGTNLNSDEDTDELAIVKEKIGKQQRALDDLIIRLNIPSIHLRNHDEFRIECYDISNIQGKFAVGSMIVFIDGKPEPNLYRRFKIKNYNEPNDFGMMREVLTRRFNQLLRSEEYKNVIEEELPKELRARFKNWKVDESFKVIPDLMIVDGGKGQLSSAYEILKRFSLDQKIPVVGLAKREEEIFKIREQFSIDRLEDFSDMDEPKIEDEVFDKIFLPRRSEALYLVQRIRDEAHRFAITYHRKLRSKGLLTT
jgi:excinuclease ABC subunit C